MMNAPLDTFIQVVGVLITLSVASERLVEVLKGYVPWLGQTRAAEVDDARRRSHIILVTGAVNIVTTFLAWPLVITTPAVAKMGDHWYVMLGLALLASGGSSVWNSVLSYLVGMKEIKKSEASVAKLGALEANAKLATSPRALRAELAGLTLSGTLGGTAK